MIPIRYKYHGKKFVSPLGNHWSKSLGRDYNEDGIIDRSHNYDRFPLIENITSYVILDSDHDGLNDLYELVYGTNPNNPDTDGDFYNDGWEISHGYNPLNPYSSPQILFRVALFVFLLTLSIIILSAILLFLRGRFRRKMHKNKREEEPTS